jgi:oxygen-independent coproporphyrinogen-3 oxidase
MVDKGQWSEADDELCARQYSILCQVLKEAGYNHYEISNFALPGYEARHNSAYWFHVPYVGLGPGAHSLLITQSPGGDSPQGHGRPIGLSVFCSKIPGPVAASDDALLITQSSGDDSPKGKWVRRWNEPDLKRYIGNPEGCTDGEELTSEQIGMERIMLALRTSDGADEEFMVSYCGEENVNRLLSEGDLERTGGGRLRIPEERFFVSDRIISEII